MRTIKFLLAIILSSLSVAACGGGYGNSTPAAYGYSISGTVTTGLAHTLFLQGVTITLNGASTASTTTAADGSYSFHGLANANYTVTPSLSGFSFSPATIALTSLVANSTMNDFVATAI